MASGLESPSRYVGAEKYGAEVVEVKLEIGVVAFGLRVEMNKEELESGVRLHTEVTCYGLGS